MKIIFKLFALFIFWKCALMASVDTNRIKELLDRSKPVDAGPYRAEVRELAKANDTSGLNQFLISAHWEQQTLSIDSENGGILKVLRAMSEKDADVIFKMGRLFAASGLQGRDEWAQKGVIVEFGYPRLLMRFGDVLVDVRDFGSLSDNQKESLVREVENGVSEWRSAVASNANLAIDSHVQVHSRVSGSDPLDKIDGGEKSENSSSVSFTSFALKCVILFVVIVCMLLIAVCIYRRKGKVNPTSQP